MRAGALPALAVAVIVAAASGCGDSGSGSSARTPAAEPTTIETSTAGSEGVDPLAGAATTPVSADPQGDEPALLERVALGRHEGFDRVVFQFRNHVPGFRVGYVEPPFTEDGSGNRIEIEGGAVVVVRMEPASGFEFVGEGVQVYTGPRRIAGAGAGTSVVREAVRIGDFEAVLSWGIGVEEQVDFRVRTTADPPRLVVDFRNH